MENNILKDIFAIFGILIFVGLGTTALAYIASSKNDIAIMATMVLLILNWVI